MFTDIIFFQSVNSLQGYGSFRAGVMEGADSMNTADPKTSTAQRKSHRTHEHEDPSKPNIPPKPSRSRHTETNYNTDHSDRSSSPKPLTSNPPSSVDVYKPMPKAPIPNGHVNMNGATTLAPNYENQSELDRMQQQQHQQQQQNVHYQQKNVFASNAPFPGHVTSPGSTYYQSPDSADHSKDKKSSQQFSLKTWLKREREQVRKGVESDDITSSPESKSHSSSKSFSRFKNSMIQKFSGGSSSKKHEHSSKRSKDNKGTTTVSNGGERNSVPYDVIRNNYNSVDEGKYSHPNFTTRENGALNLDSLEEYNRPLPDTVISPIDDPECEEPILTKDADSGTKTMISPQIRVTNEDNVVRNGDVNNNDKFGENKFNARSGWTQSKSNENPYGRVHKDISASQNRDSAFTHNQVEHAAESKRVVAQTVPLYKARIINNYENQGKFENPHAIRQQAEPVKPMAFNSPQDCYNGTSAFGNKNEDHKSQYSTLEVEHHRNRSLDNNFADSSHGNRTINHQQSYSDNNPYGYHGKMSKGPDIVRGPSGTPRKRAVLENRNYITPGNRVPMNVQSIGSLIDKFDRYNNNTPETHHPANQNALSPSKDAAVTSTPAAPRKTAANEDENETSPPLPPRLSLSPRSSKHAPHLEPAGDYRNSASYPTPDRQSYSSPHARLDNLTSNTFSPPSAYGTPKGDHEQSTSNWSQNNNSNFYTPPSGNTTRSRSFYTSPHTQPNIASGNDQTDNAVEPFTKGNQIPNGYHPSHHGDQSDERDDGYRAMLRKAANATQSTYGRHTKNTPQYSGRPSFGSPYSDSNITPYSSNAVVKSASHNNDEVAYMAF